MMSWGQPNTKKTWRSIFCLIQVVCLKLCSWRSPPWKCTMIHLLAVFLADSQSTVDYWAWCFVCLNISSCMTFLSHCWPLCVLDDGCNIIDVPDKLMISVVVPKRNASGITNSQKTPRNHHHCVYHPRTIIGGLRLFDYESGSSADAWCQQCVSAQE